jgi:hypothetical protein
MNLERGRRLLRCGVTRVYSTAALVLVAPVALGALPQHATSQAPLGELVLVLDPAAKSPQMPPAETAATIHLTRKCTTKCSRAGATRKLFFGPAGVEGKIATQGNSTVQVHGTFQLHGSEHELTVPVGAKLGTGPWTGSSKFSVPFIDWGLKNPSNFFLRVSHAVSIELELNGTLESLAAP